MWLGRKRRDRQRDGEPKRSGYARVQCVLSEGGVLSFVGHQHTADTASYYTTNTAWLFSSFLLLPLFLLPPLLKLQDFTHLGVAVPPLQYEWLFGQMVATPDVTGVHAALSERWRRGRPDDAAIAAARLWVRTEFSVEAVGQRFVSLLASATMLHRLRWQVEARDNAPRHRALLFTVVTEDMPGIVDWDTPWVLCADKDVEFNTLQLNGLLGALQKDSPGARELAGILVPCTARDGKTEVPVRNPLTTET